MSTRPVPMLGDPRLKSCCSGLLGSSKMLQTPVPPPKSPVQLDGCDENICPFQPWPGSKGEALSVQARTKTRPASTSIDFGFIDCSPSRPPRPGKWYLKALRGPRRGGFSVARLGVRYFEARWLP